MSEHVANLVAVVAPHVLWLIFFSILLILIGRTRIQELFSRLNRIEVAGISIDLESALLSAASERSTIVTREETKGTVEQLQRVRGRIATARLLWIDDNPQNNVIEMKILRTLGATVDIARTDKQALERLQGAVYDIVLSDVGREGIADAGFKFLPELHKAILNPPVIFYTFGETTLKPKGAFGVTTRPDELMQLVADALLYISKR